MHNSAHSISQTAFLLGLIAGGSLVIALVFKWPLAVYCTGMSFFHFLEFHWQSFYHPKTTDLDGKTRKKRKISSFSVPSQSQYRVFSCHSGWVDGINDSIQFQRIFHFYFWFIRSSHRHHSSPWMCDYDYWLSCTLVGHDSRWSQFLSRCAIQLETQSSPGNFRNLSVH